jgi:hypothetical protein
MRCERGCVTDPGPRLGLQLDFFIQVIPPRNRSFSDAPGLLFCQLGLLTRAGGRPDSPRHGFHLLEQHQHLAVAPRALLEEPPYLFLGRQSNEPYEADKHHFSLGSALSR